MWSIVVPHEPSYTPSSYAPHDASTEIATGPTVATALISAQ